MSAATVPRQTHFHLPSVHVEHADGSGFDYEENLYVRGFRHRVFHRVVTISAHDSRDAVLFRRETRDELSREDTELTARNAVRVERLYRLIRAGKLERGSPSPLSPVKPRGGPKKRGISTGPRDVDAPRCACGRMTLKCAKARSHHCEDRSLAAGRMAA